LIKDITSAINELTDVRPPGTKEIAMPEYVLNSRPQPTGEHEVHTTTCSHVPRLENRIPLGSHTDCHGAMAQARRFYTNVDGCYFCCNPCHKK
jgi:hypothetical protein